MNPTPSFSLNSNNYISRYELIELSEAGLREKEYRFVRVICLSWLAAYPGDLFISYLLGRALLAENKIAMAKDIFNRLLKSDPEFSEVQKMLSLLGDTLGMAHAIYAIPLPDSKNPSGKDVPEWYQHLEAGQKALESSQPAEAEQFAQKAQVANATTPLPAIFHINIARSTHDFHLAQTLADVYHTRWPDCIQFTLFLAEARLKNGDEASAVALIHQCAAKDAAGQVAERIWGNDQPYKRLWPVRMEIPFGHPIPSSVASIMGWNQLGSGLVESEISADPSVSMPNPASPKKEDQSIPVPPPSIVDKPLEEIEAVPTHKSDRAFPGGEAAISIESIKSIQDEFDRLAKKLKKPAISRSDGRFPIFVVLSSRRGMIAQFGVQTADILDETMKELVTVLGKKSGWGSLLFYPDDPTCMATLGLKPILSNDPWKIKLSLADLDKALAKYGEMISVLLIIGGPEVVPFHRLPNPIEDNDPEINSDNPYATTDENYYVPEWIVGRLPGESGPDAGLLIKSLRQMIDIHAAAYNLNKFSWPAIIRRFRLFRQSLFGPHRTCFGYTARIWEKSSQEVYNTMGKSPSLVTCPPTEANNLARKRQWPAQMAYFNLHGIPDSVEWYGQKNINDKTNTPDYPVAFNPGNVTSDYRVPRIIFSEACYGASIEGKSCDTSMALKFLSSGTQVFIGSTCTSYGTVTSPLIAADFLAQYFWNYLRKGDTAGNAFVKAKVFLSREMSKRQGYLDGEDQKTLLSFVLYGDPLAVMTDVSASPKSFLRPRIHPGVMISKDVSNLPIEQLSSETMAQVKKIVARYLPNLAGADISISKQNVAENPVYAKSKKRSSKGNVEHEKSNRIIILNKQVNDHQHLHSHFARLTLEPDGTIVKFSSSH